MVNEAQPPPESSRAHGEPLAAPRPEISTRIAGWILLFLVAYSLAGHWLPSPAGEVLALSWIFVGLPLALLAISDLGVLRGQRMFANRARQAPGAAGTVRLQVESRELARDHVRLWRARRAWRIGGAFLGLSAGAFAYATSSPAAALSALLVVATPFVLRDMQLGLRALVWLSFGAWYELSTGERACLRAYAGLVGLVTLSLALALIAMTAWFWLDPGTALWRKLGFTLVWGTWALPLGIFALRRMWQAVRRRPDPAPDILELEWVSDETPLEE